MGPRADGWRRRRGRGVVVVVVVEVRVAGILTHTGVVLACFFPARETSLVVEFSLPVLRQPPLVVGRLGPRLRVSPLVVGSSRSPWVGTPTPTTVARGATTSSTTGWGRLSPSHGSSGGSLQATVGSVRPRKVPGHGLEVPFLVVPKESTSTGTDEALFVLLAGTTGNPESFRPREGDGLRVDGSKVLPLLRTETSGSLRSPTVCVLVCGRGSVPQTVADEVTKGLLTGPGPNLARTRLTGHGAPGVAGVSPPREGGAPAVQRQTRLTRHVSVTLFRPVPTTSSVRCERWGPRPQRSVTFGGGPSRLARPPSTGVRGLRPSFSFCVFRLGHGDDTLSSSDATVNRTVPEFQKRPPFEGPGRHLPGSRWPGLYYSRGVLLRSRGVNVHYEV